MKFVSAVFLGLGVSLVSALPSSRDEQQFNWHNTDSLLAFGDSYTYVQGTDGLQNFSFIGDLQNFTFSAKQLFTDEIVPGQLGTSAGGPNWVEHLTDCFSGVPSKCKTQLWDFAFAGSDVSVDFTPLHHPFTISLQNQVKQWAEFGLPVLKLDARKTLVAVWIGINDISDSVRFTFPRNGTTDFPSFYKAIIDTEFESLETVYNAGYRNFLFMTLPPLDKTPGNLLTSTPLPNFTMVQEYNNQISASASQFESTHPGTKSMVFDTYGYLSEILDDPAKFSILNTTSFCPNFDAPDIATNFAAYGCLPIQDYFWYNTGHITFRIHQLLAGAVGDFLVQQSRS